MTEINKKSNAGRKREPDPKDTVILMVRRSRIVGKDNLDIPIKDSKGNFTLEYKQMVDKLRETLYETIEFVNA